MYKWQTDILVKLSGVPTRELQTVSAGRQVGKSAFVALWKEMDKMKPVKITWHHLPGRKLKATWQVQPRGRAYGLNEDDILPIQDWINSNLPDTRRLSFDTWLFKSDKHITMFLLRWS